ncbi:MAG: hypothetical protein KDC54_01100 [Lewinella sp.]|nr:hypothetical protein [Lewinella sp.]
MKKFIRWAVIVLGSLLALLLIAGALLHQPRPESGPSPAADALARHMQHAIGVEAWRGVRWVNWTFRTGTRYLWDKENDLVEVQWGDHRVVLHTPTRSGIAYSDGREVTDEATKAALLDKAWEQFANDSFWLIAPFKAFDPGTQRSVVTLGDGSKGLLVEYLRGGVTPGDAYLWLLDEDDRPRAWQMWVSILPIGGLTFSWENWQTFGAGVQIAQDHRGLGVNVTIRDLQLDEGIPAIAAGENPLSAEAARLLPVSE